MGVLTLFHGAHTAYVPHVGQCYTPDERAAEIYADHGRGVISEVKLDLTGLRVVEVEPYDWDADEAPGDRRRQRYKADVIVYQDATETGREHLTYRLMSKRAVAAIEKLKLRSSTLDPHRY